MGFARHLLSPEAATTRIALTFRDWGTNRIARKALFTCDVYNNRNRTTFSSSWLCFSLLPGFAIHTLDYLNYRDSEYFCQKSPPAFPRSLPLPPWPALGPVFDEGVLPLRLLQSNVSFLLWARPHRSLSKLQLNTETKFGQETLLLEQESNQWSWAEFWDLSHNLNWFEIISSFFFSMALHCFS